MNEELDCLRPDVLYAGDVEDRRWAKYADLYPLDSDVDLLVEAVSGVVPLDSAHAAIIDCGRSFGSGAVHG
jgi:hypothetical protein